jgi:hypothetical protein
MCSRHRQSLFLFFLSSVKSIFWGVYHVSWLGFAMTHPNTHFTLEIDKNFAGGAGGRDPDSAEKEGGSVDEESNNMLQLGR